MIKIIADSTCDLPKELVQNYDIDILPLHIHLGEKEYNDGVNITTKEIFAWADEHKTTPKTSAVSIGDAIQILSLYEKSNREIICFAISEQLSSTASVMRLAAKELDMENRVHVIDSGNLCNGIALLILHAADMAQEEKDVSEIISEIEELKKKVKSSFVVDTLTYLHRGGRCKSVEAIAGSALKLHPKIIVEKGKMEANKKYRGKMKSVIMSYVKDMEAELLHARKERIFIVSAGCDEECVLQIKEYIESLHVFRQVLLTEAGGVISSHCGPRTLGVFFLAE